jgi:hypothetical protein
MLDYGAVRARRAGSPGTSCLVLQILLMVIIWVFVSIKFFKFYLWLRGHNFGSRFEQGPWQDQTPLPKKGISVQPTFFTRNQLHPVLKQRHTIPQHSCYTANCNGATHDDRLSHWLFVCSDHTDLLCCKGLAHWRSPFLTI